jgi:hypothetical protein
MVARMVVGVATQNIEDETREQLSGEYGVRPYILHLTGCSFHLWFQSLLEIT